ncbi:MAG: hypothetical protein WC297_00880 [Candidatus Paceibacterota bacterium]|jgi:hypothetical protein
MNRAKGIIRTIGIGRFEEICNSIGLDGKGLDRKQRHVLRRIFRHYDNINESKERYPSSEEVEKGKKKFFEYEVILHKVSNSEAKILCSAISMIQKERDKKVRQELPAQRNSVGRFFLLLVYC